MLTGYLPAIFTKYGQRSRILELENDKSFALFDSLDNAQREHALIDGGVSELALGLGSDGEAVPSLGVLASDLEPGQRDVLYDLMFDGRASSTTTTPRPAWRRSGAGWQRSFSTGATR